MQFATRQSVAFYAISTRSALYDWVPTPETVPTPIAVESQDRCELRE
jgi:hypothetical protein